MKKTLIALVIPALLFFGCQKTATTSPTTTTTTKDPCASVTCFNGGACVNGKCSCPTGYTGDNCEIEMTGKIQFINNSNNPYNIYINGVSQGALDGKKYTYITRKIGNYTCRVLQLSGYALYPTDQTFSNIEVTYNGNKVISFP